MVPDSFYGPGLIGTVVKCSATIWNGSIRPSMRSNNRASNYRSVPPPL